MQNGIPVQAIFGNTQEQGEALYRGNILWKT
jgi:hypothetical protein